MANPNLNRLYPEPKEVARNLERSRRLLQNLENAANDLERKSEFRVVDQKHLAPSLKKSVIESLSAVIKPASLITFSLVCLYALYHTFFVIKEEVTAPSEAEASLASLKLEQEYVHDLEESDEAIKHQKSHIRRQATYISGIISMHRPNITNGGSIAKHIVAVADEMDVDPFYVTAIIASESSFKVKAKSRVGAHGLMQLMKPTAKQVYKEVTGKNGHPNRYDPEINIKLGTTYVKQLEKQFKGSRFNALAAYNWGPGNLGKALRKRKRIPKSVRKYANNIIEKTLRWRRHFNKAEEEALKI